jgi:NAD(P)-dependent dehydrogenase (short-subunit alcohol dehydrogenase family)
MEVIDDVDLSGRRALVAGGSSGIGIQTARALATAGAEVTITARNLTAGQEVLAAIVASTGSAKVHVAPLELADRSACSTSRVPVNQLRTRKSRVSRCRSKAYTPMKGSPTCQMQTSCFT